MSPIQIHWWTADQEHEEDWESLDSFLSWCASEGLDPEWTAYQADEDGDWIPFARSSEQR